MTEPMSTEPAPTGPGLPRPGGAPRRPGTPRLNAALSAFQGELPTFGADDQRTVKIDKNADPSKHYSYSYATLATILEKVGPLMAKHGLSFSSMPTYADPGDGKFTFVLAYTLAHSSGEERGGMFPLKHDGSIQSMGGAITYARRYCQGAALGIAAEQDDDGMAASMDDDGSAGPIRRQASTARATTSRRRPPAPGHDAQTAPEIPGGELPEGNAITDPMKTKIIMQFKDLRMDTPDKRGDRNALVSDIVGRPVTTITALTKAEGSKLIEALQAQIDALPQEAPDDAITEGS